MTDQIDELNFVNVDALIQKVMDFINRQDTVSALKVMKRGEELFPEESEFWYQYGMILFYTNESMQAKEKFEKAAELKPDYSEAYYGIGRIFFARNELEKAKEYYKKAADADPSNFQSLIEYSVVCSRNGENEEAIKTLKAVLEEDPENSLAVSMLAKIYSGVERVDDSIRMYERATQISPKDPQVWHDYAMVLMGYERFTEAEEAYKKTIELDKTNVEALRNFGLLYIQLDDIPKAIEQYETSLKYDPYHEQTWSLVAGMYKKTGQEEELEKTLFAGRHHLNSSVLEYMNEGINLIKSGKLDRGRDYLVLSHGYNENYLPPIMLLAESLRSTEDYKLALSYYKKAFRIKGGWALQMDIGMCLMKIGNYKKAIENLEEVYKEVPDNRTNLVYLADSYHGLKNFDKAVDFYKKAIELEPDSVLNYKLALCYKEQGKNDEALQNLELSLKLSENFEALILIGEIYIDQGKFKEAKEKLDRANEYDPNSKEVKSLMKKVAKGTK